MAWQIGFLYWLAHAALGAFLLLSVGCLAMRLCRQPVRRLRLAELTLLGCLLMPWLNLVPGLPHYALGWLKASRAEPAMSAPAADEAAPPVEVTKPANRRHHTLRRTNGQRMPLASLLQPRL